MKEQPSKQQLIRRLHTLRGIVGMSQDNYYDMLESCGAESSKDLDVEQLEKLCRFLAGMCDKGTEQAERLRRGLLRAVCQFCQRTVDGWDQMPDDIRIAYAKGVACRAAQVGQNHFNRIGNDRLRSLTFAFSKRAKDMDGVLAAAMDILAISN